MRLSGWKGRSYDLGRMSLRELFVAYATYPAIQVYAVITVVGAILAAAWTERPWHTALTVLVVVALYPFVEYGLHRYILHARILYKSPLTASLWKRVHFDHHQDPHKLDVLFGSLTNTLPMLVGVSVPVGLAVDGAAGGAAALATATLLMSVYEFCHCIQHLNYQPKSRLLRRMKQRHLAHHFHDENGNYGITGFVIDRALGTYYDSPQERPRSPTVFNLGYDVAESQRYPWVAELTGSPPRDRPPSAKETREPRGGDEAVAN
ncbi:sterol desaturase family protein [Azospirillum sp. SYSU D00513]|uniref:sterol desaturase family protein n=1 Tax=Azospirillum sp. SYSU D00513 TaxID=2812561 RepID=UPI001FFE37A5|nr:sterol desaturase family protein [Azospirillum sp. SYSU D00513]